MSSELGADVNMKILVTGANGFVGRYLLNLLKNRQHDVFPVDKSGGMQSQKNEVVAHAVNILDREAVEYCLSDVRPDAVVHLAAVSNIPLSWDNPGLAVDVNIRGTVNVLQALYRVNPRAKFLSVGSGDEYGMAAKLGVPLTEEVVCQPQNPYAISKFAAERMVLQLGKKYGMNVICTRSFNHFGPGQARGYVAADFSSQIASIERGEQPPVLRVGDLTACRDFTFVTDVVEAYAALLETDVDGGIYNVCSGKARSVQEVLDYVVSNSQVEITVEKDPLLMRPSDVPLFVGDYTKIKKATGWKAHYDFYQGLQETLDYWRGKNS